MKKIGLVLLSFGLFYSFPALSQYSASSESGADTSSEELNTLVTNLGAFLGYKINGTDIPTPVQELLGYTLNVSKNGQSVLDVFFGSIPINGVYEMFSDNSTYAGFNEYANILFGDKYKNGEGGIAVVEDFDQKDYQNEPVSQSILNLLGTPSTLVCPDTDDTCFSQNKAMFTVAQDVIDDKGFPGSSKYFTYEYSKKFLSQLHVDTLLAPLMYSTSDTKQSTGLPAANQQQEAMDFLRYITASVLPPDTMTQDDYDNLWSQAQETTDGKSTDEINKIKDARKNLMTYLLNLRVYASQFSVPMSNLASIMEKRMPQTVAKADGTSGTTKTSQAFNEFVMATWRLFSPGVSPENQWVELINKASPATTQKEMAIILSEIEYQLYLNRQIQERILLTNTLQVLQGMIANRPNTSPGNGAGSEQNS